jgi:hypothetical protein
MRCRLGPILHLRQPTSTEWRFSIGVWVASPDNGLRVSFPAAANATVSTSPTSYGDFDGAQWLGWDVSIPRQANEFRTTYTIDGWPKGPLTVDEVAIPAIGQAPRIAFFSCNGVQDPKSWTSQPDMERLWRRMRDRHGKPADSNGAGGAYHVLLGGGDQIYCDGVWRDVKRLASLDTWDKRRLAKTNPALINAIEAAYGSMYDRWNESWFADLFCRVPGVYTWDDHDIFDGWGSYEDDLQSSPVLDAIFQKARRAFTLFQLGGLGRADNPGFDPNARHFLQAARFDDAYDILLLDLRSHRTTTRVMAEAQWSALHEYLARRAAAGTTPAHLLVVSSIPVVYLNFATAEGFLNWLPWRQELEDDLRDQWESPSHQEERARLIMTLLDHAKAAGTRITILSGDVHVGARGRIVSQRPAHLMGEESEAIIHQLTSSAIVFPAPSALTLGCERYPRRARPRCSLPPRWRRRWSPCRRHTSSWPTTTGCRSNRMPTGPIRGSGCGRGGSRMTRTWPRRS